jgi:3-oxoacyl-[acyl-carrier protein] reductase
MAETRSDVLVVTGGSRGIGRAIVEALICGGHKVAFTFRSDQEAADEVVGQSGGLAEAFRLDLADRQRPAALVQEVEERIGPIAGLVNNAGVQRSELLAMTSDASWDELLDVNLGGAFRCTRAVLPGMVSRRRGAVVNVASLSALHGVPGHSAYAASKAGLVAMTRCLAREMGRRGIRVNAVVPGFVATDMTAGLAPEVISRLRSGECLADGTSTSAVADAVAYLLSDRAAAVTGQVLVVDAGTTA